MKRDQVNAKENQIGGTLNSYLHSLLLPFFLFLLAAPAQAARLQSWRFDAAQNRLDFTTDDGVQPKAQLIENPTRLVIDLPGTTLGRPAVSQSYNGAIRSVRVGQFEKGTTRIVMELAPGYTLDPSQVRFRGATAQQWSVQVPTPQLTGSNAGAVLAAPPLGSPPSVSALPLPNTLPTVSSSGTAGTLIQSIQATQDGFFLRTNAGQPQIRSVRSGDRRQMYIDVYGATLSPSAFPRDLPGRQNGVSRFQVSQFQASPPVVRLTLALSPDSPNWQASVSGTGSTGGIVVLPQKAGSATVPTVESPRNSGSQTPSEGAKIQSVDYDAANNQILIRADQPIIYTSGWDRPTGAYRITVPSAKLDSNIRGPQLPTNSPLLQVRIRQEGTNVAVLMTPASGVQVGTANQPSRQLVSLPFNRASASFPPNPTPGNTIPVPPPTNPSPVQPRPRTPNGRLVVVIDPGHGGPDPGAVGIGNLYEKNVVLDISRQVAALLEQQGIQAILTRPDDRDLDLEPRVAIAERANATVFVSIHANAISMSRPDINGLETYYFSSGLGLAQSIHRSVLQGTGTRDRRVRQARFYVIRRTSMPSVLVEVGFVTGAEDAPKLATASYRQQLAQSIARGIVNYLR
ncbi:N-acetylmuramoyl-L-alanine amidase [Myxacorys almedinensis]|uniref:N-acetylmuramoyl-L-alanine amidase n=1 Tax=Myxacorys almedinensis TaxID=2651157 RepID=UPI001EE48188|nr:N-acetylmuramoyl-L-alanine amidase [Myxacorys almedinensis]